MFTTQEYGWSQFARLQGRSWPDATAGAMAEAAAAGFTGWEPVLPGPEAARHIGALARAHGLALPSIFLTGPMHDQALAETLRRFERTAAQAAAFGCRQAMVYPSPATSPAGKTDAELARQAEGLALLARRLRPLGIETCYHPEEPDLQHAAREFHHMLLATDPAEVALCLDPDTLVRGAGGSQLALMDMARLYGARTGALHLRQMQHGIWAEVLGEGDIDLPAVIAVLVKAGARPTLIVELALENQTRTTHDGAEAHRRSLAYLRAQLLPLVGPA